jgi:hypothetical protein
MRGIGVEVNRTSKSALLPRADLRAGLFLGESLFWIVQACDVCHTKKLLIKLKFSLGRVTTAIRKKLAELRSPTQ